MINCSPSCTDEQGFLFSYYYRQWGGGEATPIWKGVLIYYSSSWPRSGYRYQSGGQLLFSQEWWDLEYLEKNPSELACEQPLWGGFCSRARKGRRACKVLRLWNLNSCIEKIDAKCWLAEMTFCKYEVIALGTCFSMFVYIHAYFHFVLIGRNLTAQSIGSHKGIERGIQIPET